jgi:hypothetical protein
MTILIAAVWNCDTLEQQSPEIRIGRLSGAVHTAWELISQIRLEQADKERASFLFTAPEYLFTAKQSHFMDEEAKERVRGGLIALSSKYPEILLMPGSIGWYKTSQRAPLTLARKRSKDSKRDMNKYLAPYENFSSTGVDYSFAPLPALREIYERGQSDRQYWQKKSLANFRDALETDKESVVKVAKNTCFAFRNSEIVNRYDKTFEACDFDVGSVTDLSVDEMQQPMLFMPGDHSPFFEDRGITYGVELCSDHNAAGLRYWVTSVQQPSIGNVDIQVVMSATTGLEQAHCVARHFVIQADSNGPAVYRANNVDDPVEPVRGSAEVAVFKLKW